MGLWGLWGGRDVLTGVVVQINWVCVWRSLLTRRCSWSNEAARAARGWFGGEQGRGTSNTGERSLLIHHVSRTCNAIIWLLNGLGGGGGGERERESPMKERKKERKKEEEESC